jgi:hypothetical protein
VTPIVLVTVDRVYATCVIVCVRTGSVVRKVPVPEKTVLGGSVTKAVEVVSSKAEKVVAGAVVVVVALTTSGAWM